MDFIIWHSKTENSFKLDRQVSREVFECDKAEYLRTLYRFTPSQAEDARRIFEKLESASVGFS